MGRNPKVVAAYSAMANLGIHVSKVKPVLKKLLKLYDKNWELIEEENYRALADAIFEEDENKVPESEPEPVHKNKNKRVDEGRADDEEAHLQDEPLQPLKRSRLRGQETQSLPPPTSSGPSSAGYPLKIPKLEDGTVPESSYGRKHQSTAVLSDGNAQNETRQLPPCDSIVDKGKQPVSPNVTYRRRRLASERAPPAVPLIIPKDEPIDDMPEFAVPLSMILPEQSSGRDSSINNGAAEKQDGHDTVSLPCRDGKVRAQDILPSSHEVAASNVEIASPAAGEVNATEKQDGHDTVALPCRDGEVGAQDILPSSHEEVPSNVEIASSAVGEVTAAEKQDGDDTVALHCRDGEVGGEDILLSSHKEAASNVEINLSAMGEEGSVKISPSVNVSMEPEEFETLLVEGNKENGSINDISSADLVAPQIPDSKPYPSGLDDTIPVSKKVGTNDFIESDDGKLLVDVVFPNSPSSMLVSKHHPTTEIRTCQYVNDLTKGEENVKIAWVNNTSTDSPPLFHYVRRSVVFRDAQVKISLSRIGNEDCCSTCMGNCVLSSKPCFCANKTGGEFAYTAQGLLKEDFLKDCIAISHHPQHYFYCKDCPLERSMSDGCLEPCKGHLKRKFIKECWSKCGCGKKCGNRVIQRGITCKLEVFLTSEGKGWGLRTLEDLPQGAFVCEFVGEILTVKELHGRNIKYPKTGKRTYPILLDANWDSGVMEDKEALCLDAGSYGNAARFINHRCFDANLVEIPVEVECPNHNYYHLAFFTSREIAAQEELTWDYGINFDDQDQPVELFQCRCGSKFCRNMKRSNRSNRSSIAR
ncbi:PREDICTED: probable inactive histone-lysine N-methyltransferase SUVR2 [Lupinus angustifolius]|uniref:probable inactive histone-lysine N-methyltransferase SUVR2 n=1 Tax=Lupinus angustifolius TaxID=3871 RepID=UPI00092F2913|nr:PREDICTED: probable inactive histone-lysine N-methyltransferase SUVR2 [Lupinus angustifolius]XP_019429979.1 PREDICTED: probable inactive histone-lysine N-methyltransferase SUVR2 [Lupinus angustifolius]XP_019429980.1 PREDICTED: probable inactive histone-lysine N-methyltransferase SUVR2 [Lupinus angustifolius]XP_019429981.1 PREDICTED: probable inactive histone-lysine N-methyltransferase SUVR2 [Lupinus angustifolius]